MGMTSCVLSPLLPTSWFRRRPNAPSPDPEEAPLDTPYKRLIAELRPPRGQRSPVPPDPSEALAYEAEKRQWIDEQKRLIAEAMRRSGGPDPRWNVVHGAKDDRSEAKGRRTPVIEELSAFEIRKRRWMAEHQRSIARERQLSRFQAALRDRQVHPVALTTETTGGPDRDSDPCERWLAERDEARKRRQRYLRNYCPFQREEECVPEEEEEEEEEKEEEEERERKEPDDDAKIERSVSVLAADGPGSVDGEFVMKSAIEKNPWGARRHSEEYYARRRQVLQSFKFVTDESEEACVGAALPSTCATKEAEPDDAEIERPKEEKKPEERDDAEIERSVPVLRVNGPGSVDGGLVMKSTIEKNPWGACRHSEEYYARHRQVLQSFKFVIGESEKPGVGVVPRSAWATRRRNAKFLRSVLGFAHVPAAAKTCCTAADAVDVADMS